MAGTTGFDRDHRRCKLQEERHHLLAPQFLAQDRYFGGIHPMKLKNLLRRIHPNSANLLPGRSPLSDINSNDLILAQSMPSGAVHTNKLATVPWHMTGSMRGRHRGAKIGAARISGHNG
jgi:hypothetical protein